MTIIEKLHHHAKSHPDHATVLREAINEIIRLQILADKNAEYAWRYEDLSK